MTLREFDRILEDENVSEIDPDPGTEADPQRHEVMMQVDSDQPEGAIADVYTPGYEMGEKVIQNAQVTVSNGEFADTDSDDGDGTDESEEESAADQSDEQLDVTDETDADEAADESDADADTTADDEAAEADESSANDADDDEAIELGGEVAEDDREDASTDAAADEPKE